MKPLFYCSDLHIGAIRSGGTTPETASALRHATLSSFRSLLVKANGCNVLVNGDAFDTGMIPFTDLWTAVEIVAAWLKENDGCWFALSAGNHDLLRNSSMMSSFDLFAKFMERLSPNFISIKQPTRLKDYDAYVIPHLANQDLFNEALKAVPKCKRLFLHANFDNRFAVEADHSLNVSPEQAGELPVDHIIFGHEHQRRSELAGKVVIVGNQIPTSVADCLGNAAKYVLRIEDDRLVHEAVWDAESDFARPDWKDLAGFETEARFIRVQGDATKEEATQVVSAIAKLRKRTSAFVITNAVSIDGVKADTDELALSVSNAKSFDVLKELMSILEPGFEQDTIKSIVEKHNVQTSQAD